MKQSRKASLIEALTSTAAGFGLSMLCQAIFLPLLGVPISIAANFYFAVIMTVVSIARQFALRRLFEALHIRVPLSPFMLAVIAERRRQVDVEGWTAEHDDAHEFGELARAGAAYCINAANGGLESDPPRIWPWSADWWKPYGIRRDLVRGTALDIAEGERFDRIRRNRK